MCHARLFVTTLVAACIASAQTYTNPVIDQDAPDPSILYDGDTYHVYVTGYYHYSSSNMVNWSSRSRFYNSADWAPDMYKHTDGAYYLYYTQSGGGGIGIAKSAQADGGFSNVQSGLGGIDANFFRDDDGSYYLYRNGVMYQNMTDPETPSGSWVGLTSCSQEWWEREGSSDYCPNEGPYMLKHNGTYYLLYSASGWAGPTYATGYATSDSPTGPFTKFEHNPILSQSDYEGVYGPGHGSVTTDDNGVHWMIYHQRMTDEYGGGSNRFVCIDPLWIDSSGVMHIRATRGRTRPAPNSDVWPARDGFAKIEFEDHDGCHNMMMFRTIGTRTMGGNTQNGTYITYRTVDFGQTPATGIDLNLSSTAASPGVVTGRVEVRLGGIGSRVIADCSVIAASWGTQSFPLVESLTGTHDIALTFTPAGAATTVANVDWLQFTTGTGVRPVRLVRHGAAPVSSQTFDLFGRSVMGAAHGVRIVRKNGASTLGRVMLP